MITNVVAHVFQGKHRHMTQNILKFDGYFVQKCSIFANRLMLKIHYLVRNIPGDCMGHFCCPIAYNHHKGVYFQEINFLAHENKSILRLILWNSCGFGRKICFPAKSMFTRVANSTYNWSHVPKS